MTKQPFSPSFFMFGGRYAAAVHADGTYVGAPNLLAGVTTTPAKPGETIVIFGTGFGPTNPPLSTGLLVNQAEPLANSVAVTFGGENAQVIYSGMIAPGLDQFNVVLPNDLPDGDIPVVAEIGASRIQAGLSTQAGVVITIHH